MARPIQTIPQGLLGLLQLKQTGSNPSELLDTVQATIDLTNWYFQRQAVDLFLPPLPNVALPTGSHGAFFFTPSVVVPQGQTWWVETYSITCNLLAAETIRLAPGWSVAAPPLYSYGIDVADIITARNRSFIASAHGFFAGPGSLFYANVFDTLTAATVTISAQVRAVAMPI